LVMWRRIFFVKGLMMLFFFRASPWAYSEVPTILTCNNPREGVL
jgi:hypothetical protein